MATHGAPVALCTPEELDAFGKILSRELPARSGQLLGQFMTPGESLVYVSTPITTGLPYLTWLSKHPHPSSEEVSAAKKTMMRNNIDRVRPLVERVKAARQGQRVVDPTELEDVPGWTQPDYHRFWCEVVSQGAVGLVMADGWQYSTGCTVEVGVATLCGLWILDAQMRPLSADTLAAALTSARDALTAAGADTGMLDSVLQIIVEPQSCWHLPKGTVPAVPNRLANYEDSKLRDKSNLRDFVGDARVLKDDVLATLAEHRNVAQFVSFGPGPNPACRHIQIKADAWKDDESSSGVELISILLMSSAEASVNVRTFSSEDRKGLPFSYGLTDPAEVWKIVERNSAANLYSIVNETINVHDGGVSGVLYQNVVEFGPNDTPRIVETENAVSLPLGLATEILSAVYGVSLRDLKAGRNERIEFSIHPLRRGIRDEHIICWESEDLEIGLPSTLDFEIVPPVWPNEFSKHIGDKVFGLLIADSLGLKVPRSRVVGRRVPPFEFGTSTGTGEIWMRTAPSIQEPGIFSTTFGWSDPFATLAKEDPDGDRIAAIVSQEAVPAQWSGATTWIDDNVVIEGVKGSGNHFMLGQQQTDRLPGRVQDQVRQLLIDLLPRMGRARIEWCYDGNSVWVVQLHQGEVVSGTSAFGTGTSDTWIDFEPAEGLDILARKIDEASRVGAGIAVAGRVGITSHVGEIIRRSRVPAKFIK